MARKAKNENELYEPMRLWLYDYLTDKYKNCDIITIDSHNRRLELVLRDNNILKDLAVGLDIQIDILGIVRSPREDQLVFIEAKNTQLTLRDLGQLWAYCKLIDPKEAFLFSTAGFGGLLKIFKVFNRVDLLNFGNGKYIKYMKIAEWDTNTNGPDYLTMFPK